MWMRQDLGSEKISILRVKYFWNCLVKNQEKKKVSNR